MHVELIDLTTVYLKLSLGTLQESEHHPDVCDLVQGGHHHVKHQDQHKVLLLHHLPKDYENHKQINLYNANFCFQN